MTQHGCLVALGQEPRQAGDENDEQRKDRKESPERDHRRKIRRAVLGELLERGHGHGHRRTPALRVVDLLHEAHASPSSLGRRHPRLACCYPIRFSGTRKKSPAYTQLNGLSATYG